MRLPQPKADLHSAADFAGRDPAIECAPQNLHGLFTSTAHLGGLAPQLEVVRTELLRALGGWRGTLEAAVPILLFVTAWTLTDALRTSILVAAAGMAAFVVLFGRSLWLTFVRRRVRWRGRGVAIGAGAR